MRMDDSQLIASRSEKWDNFTHTSGQNTNSMVLVEDVTASGCCLPRWWDARRAFLTCDGGPASPFRGTIWIVIDTSTACSSVARTSACSRRAKEVHFGCGSQDLSLEPLCFKS